MPGAARNVIPVGGATWLRGDDDQYGIARLLGRVYTPSRE